MPFLEHPVFLKPVQKDQKIWRYMDFTKFMSLIETEKLYFARQIELAKIDPLEGSLTKLDLVLRESTYQNLIAEIERSTGKPVTDDFRDQIMKGQSTMSELYKRQREVAYINCWHMNSFESAAMWSQYLSSNEGIAITSTYERLVDALKGNTEEIFIGQVSYIDFGVQAVRDGNTLAATIHKRKSYEHEKELRAVVVELGKIFTDKSVIDLEKKLSVDLDVLIENIYISPTSPDWMKDLIESIIKRYGLKCEVKKSDINSTPLF